MFLVLVIQLHDYDMGSSRNIGRVLDVKRSVRPPSAFLLFLEKKA